MCLRNTFRKCDERFLSYRTVVATGNAGSSESAMTMAFTLDYFRFCVLKAWDIILYQTEMLNP